MVVNARWDLERSSEGFSMSKVQNCEARVYGDEWHCSKCGLCWDINDGDQPDCKPITSQVTRSTPNRQPITTHPKENTGRKAWLEAVEQLKKGGR